MRLAIVLTLTVAITVGLVTAVAAAPPRSALSRAPIVAAAVADGDFDAQFVAMLNDERSAAGLNRLVPYDDLVDDAVIHTAAMIKRGDIYHSSDLTNFTTGWQSIGENVGYGPNVTKLHNAFMTSPTHRANIMGDYDRVGVASEVDPNGRIYVTVLFMKTLGGYQSKPDFHLMIDAGVAATLGVGLEP